MKARLVTDLGSVTAFKVPAVTIAYGKIVQMSVWGILMGLA